MAVGIFLIIYFGLMLVVGVPILFSIIGSAVAIPLLTGGVEGLSFTSMATTFANNLFGSNTGLTIVLFVVAGEIMSHGQISTKIFNIFAYFLGKKRGFLPIIAVLTAMFYGAVNGSAPATTAAVAALCYPLLVGMGYDRIFSGALVVASGTLGCIIPPSTVVTTISSFTGGLELIPLYILSAIEGILANLLICIYVFFYCKKHGNGDQEKINAWVDDLRASGFKKVFFDSLWAILTPIIILGTIFLGIADTAQSAALALVYSLAVSIFIYKSIKPGEIFGILRKGVHSCAGVLLLVAGAAVLSAIMGQLNVAGLVTDFVNGSGLPGGVIMLFALAIIVLLGCVNAASSAWVFPLMYTLVMACGLEPYTAMIGMNLIHTTGALTPPVGMCLFILLPMTKCSVFELGKKAIPFVCIYILVGLFFVYLGEFVFSGITSGAYVPLP